MLSLEVNTSCRRRAGRAKANIRSILPSVFNFCVTVFNQFQFHLYIPGWIGGRSDSLAPGGDTLTRKTRSKIGILEADKIENIANFVRLGWSSDRDASAYSGRGPVLDPGHHWASQISGGRIQVRHCGHLRWTLYYHYEPGGPMSLLTYSSHKCNRDSNKSLFPLRTTRKQGLFSESIAKLFLVFNAFWSQLLSCVLVDILMNQFAETMNLKQPQDCLDNILISILFLCQV